MRLSKSRFTLVIGAAFVIIWAGYMTVVEQHHPRYGNAEQVSNPAYAVQPQRNHMAIQAAAGLTAAQVTQLAGNYNYININSSDAGGSWTGQAADAAAIFAKNPNAKLFGYYRTSYGSEAQHAGMGSYGSGFQEGDVLSPIVNDPNQLGWYLRQYIAPQAGVTAGGNIGPPLKFDSTQYFNDISNPAYQTWLLNAITAWMKSAPWAGVKFDTSVYMVGNLPPNGGEYSNKTLNDLVCGTGSWDQTSADCPKVAAWNQALQQQIATAVATLHSMGKQVLYNGIAPNQKNDSDRMLNLMRSYGADGAMDESFCLQTSQAGSKKTTQVTYENITDDLNVMTSGTYAAKEIFFQTNYQDASKIAYAPYCIASFLMGWQPGQDYYRFAQGYQSSELAAQPDPTRGFLPHNGIDEIDLNLGNPTTNYVDHGGGILSRTFQNGFVAANIGDSAGSITLPSKLVQFSKGAQGQTYGAGSTVSIPARNGVFFLNDSYVHPVAAPSNTNPGSGTSNNRSATSSSPASAADVSIKAPAGTTVTASQSLAKALSGQVKFEASSDGTVVRIDYFIDGQLLHQTTTFPDSWQLDTTLFTDGEHTLKLNYYQKDGSVSSTTQTITIDNHIAAANGSGFTGVAKQALIPTTLTLLTLLVLVFILHHFGLLHLHWLYREHLDKLTAASVVTMDKPPDLPLPSTPPAQPGTVIHPNDPMSGSRPDSKL